MKSLNLVLLLVAAVAFSACAKKKAADESKPQPLPTPTPVVVPDQNGDFGTDQGPFVLRKNYVGKNLVLVYPDYRNWGVISLHGVDAKALFNSMQVKTTEDDSNESWMPAKVRRGKNIICFEQTKDEAGELKTYDCNMYIEYRYGIAQLQGLQHGFHSHVNHGNGNLEQDYKGEKLFLNKADGTGKWVIRNEDARALYFTLSPELKVRNEGNRIRIIGGDLNCSEISLPVGNKKAYECVVNLNYRNGAAL